MKWVMCGYIKTLLRILIPGNALFGVDHTPMVLRLMLGGLNKTSTSTALTPHHFSIFNHHLQFTFNIPASHHTTLLP